MEPGSTSPTRLRMTASKSAREYRSSLKPASSRTSSREVDPDVTAPADDHPRRRLVVRVLREGHEAEGERAARRVLAHAVPVAVGVPGVLQDPLGAQGVVPVLPGLGDLPAPAELRRREQRGAGDGEAGRRRRDELLLVDGPVHGAADRGVEQPGVSAAPPVVPAVEGQLVHADGRRGDGGRPRRVAEGRRVGGRVARDGVEGPGPVRLDQRVRVALDDEVEHVERRAPAERVGIRVVRLEPDPPAAAPPRCGTVRSRRTAGSRRRRGRRGRRPPTRAREGWARPCRAGLPWAGG